MNDKKMKTQEIDEIINDVTTEIDKAIDDLDDEL